jgi:biopolymer transport protein ExbD
MILLWNSNCYVSGMKTLFMTQLNVAVNENRKTGVRRMTKHNLKIDMTPMVDLGFLLIAFFVITTELSKPTVAHLYMPKDGKPMPLGKSNALTVLLKKNNAVFYYEGDEEEAIKNSQIFQTNFSYSKGLGEIIRKKQQWLDINRTNKEGRDGLMLLIKAANEANYENVLKVLDEIAINQVKKYAIIKLTQEERGFLKDKRH